MNRRGFIGATLAGLGGFFFSQKVKANDQWWEESDFVFEGVPGTEYIWPKDRLVHLEEPDADKRGMRTTIIVPTFSLLATASMGDLNHQMSSAVAAQKDTDGDKYCGSHIHLIRIQGKPNEVGIMMFSKKCHPVIDCWADSDIREKRQLKSQRERFAS